MGTDKQSTSAWRLGNLSGNGFLAILGASVLLGAGRSAVAQSSGGAANAPNSGSELEEIVVTATRREATVQEVPVSIFALSTEELIKKNIVSVDQYSLWVPSLNFNRPGHGDRQGIDITVRGVSNTRLLDGSAGFAAATTGFYIDDVAVTPVDPFIYDVARMEFLKGPQGTYFGQASMGGTVRIITNKPDSTQFLASAETKLAQTQDADASFGLRGMLNLPIIENMLAVRVVGFGDLEGGYVDWRPPSLHAGLRGSFDEYPELPSDILWRTGQSGLEENANDETAYGGRIAVTFTPTDSLTISPVYMFQDKEVDHLSSIDKNLNRGLVHERYVPTPHGEEFEQASLSIDYDFSGARLTSVTGMFDRDVRFVQDTTSTISGLFGTAADGSIASIAYLDQSYQSEIVSQELRLTSTTDLRLGGASVEWLVGAAFVDEKKLTDFLWMAPDHNANAAPGNEIPGGDQGLYFASFRDAGYQNVAAFGDFTFKLLDERLHLSAGARWFDQEWDLNEVTNNRNDPPNLVFRPPQAGDETGVVPRASASFFLTDQQMVYVSASKGFRAGGPGLIPAPPDEAECLEALMIVGIEPGVGFESDELWNYEIGTKNTFGNGSVLFNSALFYIDWSDLQASLNMRSFHPGCGRTVVTNVGETSIQGVEFELSGSPTENLFLSLNAAYVKAELGEPPEGVLVGQEGDPLQNSPEWSGTISGEYHVPRTLGGRYDSWMRADVSYTDDLVSDQAFASNPLYQVPAKTVANLRFGIAPVDGSWSADLFVDNVTNEDIYYGSQPLAGEAFTHTMRVGRPRTFGVVLRKNWQ